MNKIHVEYIDRQMWTPLFSFDGTIYPSFQIQCGLINDRARFYKENNVDHNCESLTTDQVKAGQKYRFRVNNTGELYIFVSWFMDEHTLFVILADGHDIEPVHAESVISFPGERFDFELTADQPVGNYWIRGITLINAITVLMQY